MLSLMDTAMELLREDKMKIKNMLIIACSCFLMAGCTQTGTDAIDTMENQAGDVSVSLGMDQAAVEKNLGTGTQLDATEDPQMETISYGEGADYLVVIYQEGKVISLGTYWEDLEDLNAGTDTSTPDQDSKWQTTEGIARRKVPGQEFISRGWQPAVSESFPDKGNDRRPDLCVDRRGSREDNQPDHAGLFCE